MHPSRLPMQGTLGIDIITRFILQQEPPRILRQGVGEISGPIVGLRRYMTRRLILSFFFGMCANRNRSAQDSASSLMLGSRPFDDGIRYPRSHSRCDTLTSCSFNGYSDAAFHGQGAIVTTIGGKDCRIVSQYASGRYASRFGVALKRKSGEIIFT